MTRPQIVAGPDDGDDPGVPDLDDELGEDEPPQRPARNPRRREPERRNEPDDDGPSYNDLMEEVVGLRERNRKNNQELQKRRQVQQWMQQHSIEDLDSWLGSLGVDRETGQPIPAAPPTASPPTSGNADAEVERRVALAAEQHQAQLDEHRAEWDTHRGRLEDFVRSIAIEPALTKAGFTGGDVSRALKVMDVASIKIEMDEDGHPQLVGLDEAINSLKDDIPEWFRPRNGPRVPRTGGEDVDGARRRPTPPKPPTWDEQVNRRLTGSPRT